MRTPTGQPVHSELHHHWAEKLRLLQSCSAHTQHLDEMEMERDGRRGKLRRCSWPLAGSKRFQHNALSEVNSETSSTSALQAS